MYSPPMYTGRRSMEPIFSSKLIDKLCGKSRNKIKKENKELEINKLSQDSNNRKEEIDIKLCIRKLQRLTMLLPLVLCRSEAYQKGLHDCNTCTITSDVYKMEMKNSKVIEMLVDGVIEKEQIESINEDNKKPTQKEKILSNKPSSQTKGNNISFEMEVYCEMDEIQHNLKCILIGLQRNLGNLLVQICYVKARKIEEKNKNFIASVSDLKVIKYEHSNLTDKIITLLKSPPPSKANVPKICVACMKEKMMEINLKLSSVLKTARHLNLVMRNAQEDGTNSACCSRDYPHIHAECQNKPVVLKYTQPFTPANPSKVKSPGSTQQSLPGQSSSHTLSNPEHNDESRLSGQKRKSDEISTDKNNIRPKKKKESSQSSMLQPHLDNSNKQVEDANDQVARPDKSIKTEDPQNSGPKPGILDKEDSITNIPTNGNSTNNKPQEDGLKKENFHNENTKTNKQIKDEDDDEKLIKDIYPSEDRSSNVSMHQPSSEDYETEKEGNELYCGCNTDKMYEKLGIKIPTKDTTKDLISEASSGSSSPSYLKEEESEYKKPNVQFQTYLMNLNNSKIALPIPPETFKHPSNQATEHENNIHSEQIEISKENHNRSINPVDSVLLTKQRLSVAEHTIRKDKRGIQEGLSDSTILKSRSDTSKPVLIAKTKSANLISKSHSSEIRHQNKKVEEVLKCVGKDNLLHMSSPANCCSVNKAVNENQNYLPISVSLNSLPLDNEDLNYISRVAGKPIPHNDTIIISDEENTAKEYKWKKEQSEIDQDETKWSKALTGNEIPNINCVSTMAAPQKCITPREKIPVKGYRTDEDMVLPTITEEEINNDDYIPFMPSIPSLTTDEDEKKHSSVKKQEYSILNNKSVELRYLTIECPKVLCMKEQKQFSKTSFSKLPNITCNQTRIDKYKTDKKRDVEIKANNYESVHNCDSRSENLNFKGMQTDNIKGLIAKSSHGALNRPLTDVEEMIMIQVIYLNSNLEENNSETQNNDCLNQIIKKGMHKKIPYQSHGIRSSKCLTTPKTNTMNNKLVSNFQILNKNNNIYLVDKEVSCMEFKNDTTSQKLINCKTKFAPHLIDQRKDKIKFYLHNDIKHKSQCILNGSFNNLKCVCDLNPETIRNYDLSSIHKHNKHKYCKYENKNNHNNTFNAHSGNQVLYSKPDVMLNNMKFNNDECLQNYIHYNNTLRKTEISRKFFYL